MFQVQKKEFLAELFGTFVLMTFGLAVNAQVGLGDGEYGDYLSINIGWGLAVVFGVYVAGGVTGAHINPAVTLALAVNRQLAWSKVLPYMAAQFIGAFVASALIYVVYLEALDHHEIARARELIVQQESDDLPEASSEALSGVTRSTASSASMSAFAVSGKL